MSNSLGALGIDVFANTASFESDMGRAARVAERDMAVVERAATMAGKAIAGIAVAGASGFAFMIQQSISARAALDDMADVTGDNVTYLDGLRRTAYVAGIELEKLESVIARTAKGLDTKRGASAVGAIGLDIEHLKSLKPGEALNEIAQALAKYEDGQGKINAAAAIWGGREGPRMLALMKDLAEAGVQQGRITAEQAAQAERVEKEWRKLLLVFKDVKEGIATTVIPIIGDLIAQMTKGIEIAGSFGTALRLFGMSNVTADSVGALRKELEDMERLRDRERGRGNLGAANALDRDIADARKKLEFAKFLEQQAALRKTGSEYEDARDAMARRRPGIAGVADEEAVKRGRAPKDTTAADMARAQQQVNDILDEANRLGVVFLQNQDRQLERERERLALLAQRSEVEYLLAQHAALEARDDQLRADALKSRKDETRELEDAARALGLTFSSAFEDAVIGGKSLSEVLKSLAMDVGRIFLRKAVTEPLAAAGSDFFKSLGVGDWMKGLFKADGGAVSASQPYIVGERGPELFVPGASGAIVPNHALRGGGGLTIEYLDVRGADMAAVRRIERVVAEVNGSIERRAVAAVADERMRGGNFAGAFG